MKGTRPPYVPNGEEDDMVVVCPNCRSELELDDAIQEGQHVNCPCCNTKFTYANNSDQEMEWDRLAVLEQKIDDLQRSVSVLTASQGVVRDLQRSLSKIATNQGSVRKLMPENPESKWALSLMIGAWVMLFVAVATVSNISAPNACAMGSALGVIAVCRSMREKRWIVLLMSVLVVVGFWVMAIVVRGELDKTLHTLGS